MKGILHLFYGIVRGGKIAFEDVANWRHRVGQLEGREVAVTIKAASEIRSNAENRYYWGIIVKIVSEEMAILPEEAHDFLKFLFLKVGVEKNGKRWEIARSTTTLSVGEFEDYCEKIRQWSAVELNTVIPLPNEVIPDDGGDMFVKGISDTTMEGLPRKKRK